MQFLVEPLLGEKQRVEVVDLGGESAQDFARVGDALDIGMRGAVKFVVFVQLQRIEIRVALREFAAMACRHAAHADQALEFEAHLLQRGVVLANHFLVDIEAIQAFLDLADGDRGFTDDAKNLVEYPERYAHRFFARCRQYFLGFRALATIDEILRQLLALLRLRLLRGCSRRRGFVVLLAHVAAVDTVGPVEHILQHALGVLGRRGNTLQRFEHRFEGIGGFLHRAGQRGRRSDLVTGDIFENILDMVGQVGDTLDTDQVARSFEGVRDALRSLDILLNFLAAADRFHQPGKGFRMAR